MDPDISYAEARRFIDNKYGDPYNTSNAFIKKMTEWPMLKPRDDDGLNCFSTFLAQCCSAMKSLSYLIIRTTCKPWPRSYPSTSKTDGNVSQIRRELDIGICQASICLLISLKTKLKWQQIQSFLEKL